MSQRIQHKKSSTPGNRPSNLYLEPGELAVNSSSGDPGLFFELSDGTVAKVGPTHIGPTPPQTDTGYGIGEQWFNESNQTGNIWVPALDQWVPVLSPFCGGSETIVFVGSEFPQASDSIENDGYSRPFSTLNRAVIEIAKRILLSGAEESRYVIYLLPGNNICVNDPGISFSEFERSFSQIKFDSLGMFNPESGGLLIPRGTSIVGLDLRKSKITPTYFPFWSRRLYETEPSSIAPRTSITKWTGNCYFSTFTYTDKIFTSTVNRISGDVGQPAILKTIRPHGLRADGELVTVEYLNNVPRLFRRNPTILEGTYRAEPTGVDTFNLRSLDTETYILREQLPDTTIREIIQISSTPTTHHRLSSIEFAKLPELNSFYAKVQKAFGDTIFSGVIKNTETSSGETVIVSQATEIPSTSLSEVSNSSPYVYNVCIRSNYGLGGLVVDGNSVTGFKSALACNFTSVSLQNDPDTYEIYSNEKWVGLRDLYLSVKGELPEKDTEIIKYMVDNISLENIRYYHRDSLDIERNNKKSSGLVDDNSDTRHFSVKSLNNAFIHCVSSMAIGLAVNYWAKGGGKINLTNANSTFGGIALRSEGFSGIGTIGGSESLDRGFIVQGIRRPKIITAQEVEKSIEKTFFNSNIVAVGDDFIEFSSEIDLSDLYPYTLKPGDFIWVDDYNTGSSYRAILRNQLPLISADKKRIFVQSGSNQINNSGSLVSNTLDLPYLRRFVDPRKPQDQYYSLWIKNTSPEHRPPQIGSILRFAEKPGETSSNLIKLGVQLDPGSTGGWGHMFVVVEVSTKKQGNNPNKNSPLFNQNLGQEYYISVAPVDYFNPWIPVGPNGFNTSQFIYPEGAISTFRNRNYYSAFNTYSDLSPENSESPWSYSLSYEYCQPIDRTWFSDSIEQSGDILSGLYVDTTVDYCYSRGVGYKRKEIFNPYQTNLDNGFSSLGVISPDIYDPWWLPTKRGITRFLYLLGYTYEQMATFLIPQSWSNRDIDVQLLPDVNGKGYALSKGNWPIEFNQPSTILCGNHSWEWCGYLNYGKGLPKYQKGELTLRQKIDALSTEAWGGKLYVTGFTEQGEFVNSGETLVI